MAYLIRNKHNHAEFFDKENDRWVFWPNIATRFIKRMDAEQFLHSHARPNGARILHAGEVISTKQLTGGIPE